MTSFSCLGTSSPCSIRGLIWALGSIHLVKARPQSFELKGKKCFLELKLMDAFEQLEKVLKFVNVFENVDHSMTDEAINWKNGIYMKMFVDYGIIEVIRSFNGCLREIEESLLLEPSSISVESLSTAQLMYETYATVNNIIQQICDRKLSGCQILDICCKFAIKSEESVAKKVNILIKCLHKQMLKQISSWILYGELNDKYSEFFIKQIHLTDGNMRQSIQTQTSLETNSISGEFSISLIESTTAPLPFDKKAQQALCDDIDKCYEIDGTQLPSHLPYSLVSKMFSLGKFMIQIKCNPSNKIPVGFMSVKLSEYGIEEERVRHMLKELEESEPFHHHMLQQLVDSISSQINKYMRRVAEEQGELSVHHRNIFDVYLMGRGELFKYFLDKASYILINDTSKVFSRSLDVALDRVARDLYGTDDVKFLKRFHFALPPKRETSTGRSALSVMKLVYKPPWPLHLIYTQEAIHTYNIIFKFLIELKRAHIALIMSWNDIKEISQETFNRSAYDLHFRLISLLTNLESYVFIDVIQSETESFNSVVENCDSFDQIQSAHAKLLSNIIMRLFLPHNNLHLDELIGDNQSISVEMNKNVGMVQKEIINLFLLTHQFAMAVRVKMESITGTSLLDSLNNKFDLLVINLISLVRKINEKYCSEYLRMLILRLDYNDYYSQRCDTVQATSI